MRHERSRRRQREEKPFFRSARKRDCGWKQRKSGKKLNALLQSNAFARSRKPPKLPNTK